MSISLFDEALQVEILTYLVNDYPNMTNEETLNRVCARDEINFEFNLYYLLDYGVVISSASGGSVNEFRATAQGIDHLRALSAK